MIYTGDKYQSNDFASGKYKSKSEVRRLIQQGAVKLNGEKTSEFSFVPEEEMVIQVGKGNVFKLCFNYS